MFLELEQEGNGRIEIFQSIPKDLESFLIEPAIPLAIKGEQFKGLLQELKERDSVHGLAAIGQLLQQ
jgi:hypothetical protein